jgi:hypothetical protein
MRQATWWEAVSDAGGAGFNEDLVKVFGPVGPDGAVDILVLDGATSLVEDAQADGGSFDVVWFVKRFAHEFGLARDAGVERCALLDRAARATSHAYAEHTAGRGLPDYAWPLASLAWLRAARAGDTYAAYLTSLGDCKVLLRLPGGSVTDLDPIDTEPELSLYRVVAGLRAEGVLDPAARFERMLPLLRERRAAQNLDPHPNVLTVRPRGPYATRERSFEIPAGSMLLAMSDGFWRLVDPYGLMTARELGDAVVGEGLDAVLARLRAYETGAGGAASLMVKRADDASAVALHAGA